MFQNFFLAPQKFLPWRKFIANKEEIFGKQRAFFEIGGSKKNRVI